MPQFLLDFVRFIWRKACFKAGTLFQVTLKDFHAQKNPLFLWMRVGGTPSPFLGKFRQYDKNNFEFFVKLVSIQLYFVHCDIAKLSPAQSNSNSVVWAEIALIPLSPATHPATRPPGHPPGIVD